MTAFDRSSPPPRLAKRPQLQGYPVPYVTLVRPDGTPDFKITDEAKRIRALRERRCALCGEPLEYRIAFIGGESLVNLREFYDAGMHEDCARYAARACPFLALTDSQYASPQDVGPEVTITHHVADRKRPARMALVVTRAYDVVRRSLSARESVLVARIAKPIAIDWGVMPTREESEPTQSTDPATPRPNSATK